VQIDFTWNTVYGEQTEYIFDADKITFAEDYITLTDPADVSMPSIINVEGVGFTFLKSFVVSSVNPSSGSIIKFQISNDNYNWYYYDTLNEEWTDSSLTTTVSGSNLPSELTATVMEAFPLEIDAGLFYWKMYFISDGVSPAPQVSALTLRGDQYYTTVKKVRDLMNSFGLRSRDPLTGEYCEETDYLSDSKLKGWIPIADSYINNRTFTNFYYHRDAIEYYDGNGKDSIRTYNFPMTKLTHVIMYNPLLQAMRTFLDFELIIHPEWGEVFLPPIYPAFLSDSPARSMFGNIFITGRRNIEIQYDWGFSTTPEDICTAAGKYVGVQIMSAFWANLMRGMVSRSFDGYSESFGAKPFAGIIEMWQKEIDQIIVNHIKIFPRSI